MMRRKLEEDIPAQMVSKISAMFPSSFAEHSMKCLKPSFVACSCASEVWITLSAETSLLLPTNTNMDEGEANREISKEDGTYLLHNL